MAPESKINKRKASVSTSDATVKKKAKKTAADPEVAKKRKASTDDVAAKPAKKSKATSAPIPTSKATTKSTSDKKRKSIDAAAKKTSPKKVLSSPSVSVSEDESDEKVADEDAENSDDEQEVDDQTAALLAGFDSEEEDPEPEGETFKEGADVGKLSKKVQKKALAAQKKASESDAPGTVYLGHIPHGFYEHEIRAYFSQFGDITRLRMSRNPKTGKSKHYAFVEFKSTEVADIVAKTMDNYLLFGHILKCKLLAPGQAHKDLWKGANKRFKAVPWNKIAGRKLKQGMDEAGWLKREENEDTRRAEKAGKLKAIGYEFEAPKLKSAKNVPKTKREDPKAALEAEAETDVKAIEASSETESQAADAAIDAAIDITEAASSEAKMQIVEEFLSRSEKPKKSKKGKETAVIGTVQKTEVVEEVPEVEPTKGKKKKSKKTEKVVEVKEVDVVVEATAEEPAPEAEKPKKSKKSKVAKENKVEESAAGTEVAEKPSTTRRKESRKAMADTMAMAAASVGKEKKVKKQKSSASLA